MKKVKYFIGLILLIIIILIISLLLIKWNITKKNKPQEVEIAENYPNVKNEEDIFNTVNCINKYFDLINQNNSSFYGRSENGTQIKTTEESKIKQSIKNILAQDYIEKKSVTLENIYDNIPTLEEKVIFVPLEMKVKTQENIQKYIVKGIIENLKYEFVSNIYITVNVDTQNQTFSIEPTNNENKSLAELEKNIDIKTIEENENNKITKEVVNDQYICTQLLYFYKRLALSAPEIAYDLMDDEYKTKRYENVENFKVFVENQADEIKGLTLNKFLINEERKEFVCQDKNENYYIFEIGDNLLDYKYKLDTYTIPSQENKEIYEKATEEEKVTLVAQEFIDMLNTRDYHTIYNLLDQTFKDNYGLTEEKLTYYFKEYYFSKHYTYKIKSIDKQSDVYIQEIYLYEKGQEQQEEENYNNKIELMVRLGEGTDFTISLGYVNF